MESSSGSMFKDDKPSTFSANLAGGSYCNDATGGYFRRLELAAVLWLIRAIGLLSRLLWFLLVVYLSEN